MSSKKFKIKKSTKFKNENEDESALSSLPTDLVDCLVASSSKAKPRKRRASEKQDDMVDSRKRKRSKIGDEYGDKDNVTGRFVCKKCEVSFDRKSRLKRHYLSVHEDLRPHQCTFCPMAFHEAHHLASHIRMKHDDVRFQCELCEKSYKHPADLANHIKFIHKQLREKICTICSASFFKTSDLNKHISAVHEKIKDFECDYCGSSFSTKHYLRCHIESVHFGMKNFECECGSEYYTKTRFKRHQKTRKCNFCEYSSNCYQMHFNHRAKHTMRCDVCEAVFEKYYDANNHGLSHIKDYSCNIKDCAHKFSRFSELNRHLIQKHNFCRCFVCAEIYETSEGREEHLKQEHQPIKCIYCDIESAFKFYDPQLLAKHVSDSHKDIFYCNLCSIDFESLAKLKIHKCTKNVSADVIKCFNILAEPPNLEEIEEDSTFPSYFANKEGIIDRIIPGWPMQATCSIDTTRNVLISNKSEGCLQMAVNQNQQLIQNGTTAILTWCTELNSLSHAVEVIEWKKNVQGSALAKRVFSRRKIRFKKDSQDILFNVSTNYLSPNLDLGHARAAGNCFKEIDFVESFSNLNFWPMDSSLNRISWKLLESNLRNEAKNYKRLFITTGAIFMKHGKVVSKYTHAVLIPYSFYKVAVFERVDSQYEIKSYLMYNTSGGQSVKSSEVSLILIENLTKKYFLTPSIMDKITQKSKNAHLQKLRRVELSN